MMMTTTPLRVILLNKHDFLFYQIDAMSHKDHNYTVCVKTTTVKFRVAIQNSFIDTHR